MSAAQGCTGDREVVESFKEALKGRVGADRYRMWFTHGVEFAVESASDHPQDGAADNESSGGVPATRKLDDQPMLIVSVRGQFALDRLRKNFLSEIRGAAMQACGSRMDVQLSLREPIAQQVHLPLESDDETGRQCDVESQLPVNATTTEASPKSRPDRVTANQKAAERKPARSNRRGFRQRGSTKSLSRLISDSGTKSSSNRSESMRRDPTTQPSGAHDASLFTQPSLPELDADDRPASGSSGTNLPASRSAVAIETKMTSANFIPGNCNRLAHTAMVMACQAPSTATPLFLCGPTGTGKTHMMAAIADQLRRRHRMRRVIHLSAEQFTNDFINSVGNSGITAFRRRYREVDALLIDDVQFLGAKKATLREMLYTVETLAGSGRPLVFSGLQSPTEIDGLSRELAGRMAAGLVCSIQPLDGATREELLRRWISERCQLEVPRSLTEAINPMLAGDGRVISGVVNVINTLQRMFGRAPTFDELRQHGGHLLRSSKPMTTLSVIELAVCETFQLPPESLRGKSQTRAITGPRMLAMYLSRQLTSAAYSEISHHFGGRSHSTAISAEQNVKTWLAKGGEVGRGRAAMSAREALDRVETLLRSG